MRVIIDIQHPADVNFFKNAINILIKKGFDIDLVVRSRGVLVSILQRELPNIPFTIIGKHYSARYKKILYGIKRELDLLLYLKTKKFDVGIAFNPEICYVSRILGKPSLAFVDDYEYKLAFYISKYAPTYLILPEYIPVTGKNIYKYKGLKELAYLHPKYFKPDKKVTKHYGLKPNEYVFIREIASTSLNYRGASSELHKIIRYLKEMGLLIVVSLEDNALIERFKADCLILEEPVEDIYSLLSFAALTISSGDTMARESCLVGTPAIYTGGRDMCVNEELIKNGCMFKVDNIGKIQNTIDHIIDNRVKNSINEFINHNVEYTWDDVTEIIVKSIMVILS